MSKTLLIFGDQPEHVASKFEGYEWKFADPLGGGLRRLGLARFDAIYASLVLQRVPYRDINGTLREWTKYLKGGGQMYVTAPSLEWAAVQIVSERPLPVIIPFLFGNQGSPQQFHRSGFLLPTLRRSVAAAGLEVRTANVFETEVQMGDEKFKVEQLLVVGVKPVSRKRRKRK